MKGEGFEIDWQSKCDFTASTYAFVSTKSNYSAVTYFEQDEAGNLIPFGDDRSNTQSHTDITLLYCTTNGGCNEIFNELKERYGEYTHNSYYVTATTEGEIMEPYKVEIFKPMIKQGKQVRWCVLYPDGKIRIWNLNKLDIDSLPRKNIRKHKYSIDQSSEYIIENEYLLPADKSIIIDRIKGDGKQGDS